MNKKMILGSFCGVMTGVCWGVSAVFGQFLFENRDITPQWLVAIRLLFAGVVLCTFSLIKNRETLTKLVKTPKHLIHAAFAGILGTMTFQMSSFKAVQTSNAGTATVLQYLAPVFILIYLCIRFKQLPKKIEVLSICLAVSGIFLISTHGNIHELVMTPEGLFWGLALAFFMFLNTILPEDLYKVYPTTIVSSVAFLCGGMVLTLIVRPWNADVVWDLPLIVSMFFIVVVGSVAAYLFYAQSIKLIGSEKASLCACSEPVTATILSVVWLHTNFMILDLLGFALIISTIFLLTKTDS